MNVIVFDDSIDVHNTLALTFPGRIAEGRLHLAEPSRVVESGLDLVRQFPDAFVFVDIMMPRQGGTLVSADVGLQVFDTLVNDFLIPPERVQLMSSHLKDGDLDASLRQIAVRGRLLNKGDLTEEVKARLEADSSKHRRSRRRDERWVLADLPLRQQFGGKVVAVHGCKLWATGDDIDAVLAAATQEPGAPPAEDFLIAVVPADVPVDVPAQSWRP